MLTGSIKTNDYHGRYYMLSWTATQSIPNNSSTISWTISCAGGSASYYAERELYAVINGITVFSKGNKDRVERYAGTVATGTLATPIQHNTDGSKSFSMSLRVACFTDSINLTKSGTFALDNIPRQATITAAPNFNDEENPTISYSNPAGEAVEALWACISLTGEVDNIQYRDIDKQGNTYTFELTEDDRSMLRYNTNSGSTSRTIYFIIATSIGGTIYKSTLAKTLTIVNCSPVITTSVKDVGSASVALTGNENTIIRGFNYALARMENQLYKGATIVSQTITCGSSQLIGASGGADAMEGGFNNVETPIFVFSLTDSRGQTATQTITMPMVSYIPLTCDLAADAPTATGVMAIGVSGNYFQGSFGIQDNYLALEYRLKVNNGEWGSWALLTDAININNGKYTLEANISGLDYRNSYTIQARAQDRCLLIESATKKVKTTPVFDWGENDFNFNVPVNAGGGLLLNNQSIFDLIYPTGCFIYTTREESPETYLGAGRWQRLKDMFLLAAGDTFQAGTLGGEAAHTLTIDEMPAHSHSLTEGGKTLASGTAYNRPLAATEYDEAHNYKTSPRGGNQPHNNMPPYRAVYVWERIA